MWYVGESLLCIHGLGLHAAGAHKYVTLFLLYSMRVHLFMFVTICVGIFYSEGSLEVFVCMRVNEYLYACVFVCDPR